MSWTYSTNYMGPAMHFYELHNIPYTEHTEFSKLLNKEITFKTYHKEYAGGRIDAYCNDISDPDYSHYGAETSLPIMEAEDYLKFSYWLDNFKSDKFLHFEEIRRLFEKDTSYILRLFEEEL